MSLVVFSSQLSANASVCSPISKYSDGDAFTNWNFLLFGSGLVAMIALNFLMTALTYLEVSRMRQEMHAMKRDALEAGKIMYTSVLSLKAAISYIADIILNDLSDKPTNHEFRGITSDKIANGTDEGLSLIHI